MELLGMLQHLASWQFLAVVALLDVCLIFLQLTAPAPGLTPLFPSSPHPRVDAHAELLERVAAERGRLGEEMRQKVLEIRNLTKALRFRAEVLDTLDRSIGRLEDSIQRLQGDREGGGGDDVDDDAD